MTDQPQIIDAAGQSIQFNKPSAPGETHVVSVWLHRCEEVKCGPEGTTVSYPKARHVDVEAKADLDSISEFVFRDAFLVIQLDERDGELWLRVGMLDEAELSAFMAYRAKRVVHHLSLKLTGAS